MAAPSNIKGRVRDIIHLWCIPEAERAAAPMRVSPQARAFWVKHYTPRFTKALKDGRTWEFDGKGVLKRSIKLGRWAVRFALKSKHTRIMADDAAAASAKNDCSNLAPRLAGRTGAVSALQLMAFWCR